MDTLKLKMGCCDARNESDTRDELKKEPQGLEGDWHHPFEDQVYREIDSSSTTRRHQRLPLMTPQWDNLFPSGGFD
jgi:hypothetical protein